MTELWAGVDPNMKAVLVSAVITILIGIVGRTLQPRAKLLWSQIHGFLFLVPVSDPTQPHVNYHTSSHMITNAGRETAKDIELILNFQPEHFEISPPLSYRGDLNPDDRFIIHLDMLGARDFFSLHMIGSLPLPSLLRVRCSNGRDKNVQMRPTRIFSKGTQSIIAILMLVGAFSVVFWPVRILLF